MHDERIYAAGVAHSHHPRLHVAILDLHVVHLHCKTPATETLTRRAMRVLRCDYVPIEDEV